MKGDNVLVLDAQGPNGLALCRTLGKKGLSVTAGGYSPYLAGMLSRYTDDSYVHPHVRDDETAFVDHLSEHLSTTDYAAVFSVTDVTTRLLSKNKERLEATGTRIGVEDWGTYLTANDKKRLFELVEPLDVPNPRTDAPTSLAEVAELDETRSSIAVIKPRRTTVTDEHGESFTCRMSGPNYVDPDEDLVERFEHLLEREPALQIEYPLIQEFVDGPETMCTVGLADNGELLAFFQHKKFRVFPPSGGIGAVRQGTWEPRMYNYTERIVEALEWTGPLHVEFMKTHDGDFSLIEVNGRYWGSLALTINSGVDIPWLHYHQLLDVDIPPRAPGYRTDLKQRKLFYKDLLWLRHNLSTGNHAAIVPFITSFFTTNEEHLDSDDPFPIFGLVPRTMKALSDWAPGQVQRPVTPE